MKRARIWRTSRSRFAAQWLMPALLLLAAPSLNAQVLPTAGPGKPFLTLEALRAKYADKRSRYMTIDGVEVHYKDEGRGPAILMIHGSQSTLKTWDYIAPQLTKRYRVIRYDIPPQGLSGPVSAEAAARVNAGDYAATLLQRLGVTRATVVGVSSGGTTGMYLAAQHPDMVERLILSNTPADPVKTDHMKPSPEFAEAQRIAQETGFQTESFWNAFLDFFTVEPKRLDAGIRAQYYDFNRRTPEKNYTALIGLVANHERATAAMAKVRAPTLLIWGARDPLLIPASADNLAGYLTGTQVSKILLPDVGHYPPLEVPERFAKLIAAYIEAATPAASH